ncbi:D-2-hydroxyacid dehydrogenase [Paenibacillus sp.]|uniref:D-2-hydroxyacid dehydrogenase n=1 Tax=Paenibacillus sp. TaxID=58172 RepID=UPI002810DDC9|nr:D-2-hydroxyacid dehydrogenase [Paenibacillus sp.]
MNIVVLDGYTLNPGDLDWSGLQALGEVTVYDRTPAELVVERALDADLVLTNKTPLRAESLERLPKLQYIGVLATGYDVVDVSAADRKGVTVTNVPNYGTDSVAQFVFALILELTNRVGLHSDSVHAGAWSASPDFSYWRSPLTELSGKTLGIIGIGRIGSRTAEIAAAFGMKVKGYAPRTKALPAGSPIELADMDEVLRSSDFLSLHCPLTDDTRELVNRTTIAKMKPSAFVINTARGALIREVDLADALREGRLAGAALDVLTREPPEASSPLLGLPNCVITPHIAWASREARARLLRQAVDNVRDFLDGAPSNVVRPAGAK